MLLVKRQSLDDSVVSSRASLAAPLWTLSVFVFSLLVCASIAIWLLVRTYPGTVSQTFIICATAKPAPRSDPQPVQSIPPSLRERMVCPELQQGEIHLQIVDRFPWPPDPREVKAPPAWPDYHIRALNVVSSFGYDFSALPPVTLLLALMVLPMLTATFFVQIFGARLSPIAEQGAGPFRPFVGYSAAGALGLALGGSAMTALHFQWLDPNDFAGFRQDSFAALISSIPITFLIFAIAIGPLLEEFVFRGRLLRAFNEAGWPILGVIVVSNFFALLHGGVIGWTTSSWILFFTGSCVLSYLYLRQRSWILCYVAHAVYNATVLTWPIIAA